MMLSPPSSQLINPSPSPLPLPSGVSPSLGLGLSRLLPDGAAPGGASSLVGATPRFGTGWSPYIPPTASSFSPSYAMQFNKSMTPNLGGWPKSSAASPSQSQSASAGAAAAAGGAAGEPALTPSIGTAGLGLTYPSFRTSFGLLPPYTRGSAALAAPPPPPLAAASGHANTSAPHPANPYSHLMTTAVDWMAGTAVPPSALAASTAAPSSSSANPAAAEAAGHKAAARADGAPSALAARPLHRHPASADPATGGSAPPDVAASGGSAAPHAGEPAGSAHAHDHRASRQPVSSASAAGAGLVQVASGPAVPPNGDPNHVLWGGAYCHYLSDLLALNMTPASPGWEMGGPRSSGLGGGMLAGVSSETDGALKAARLQARAGQLLAADRERFAWLIGAATALQLPSIGTYRSNWPRANKLRRFRLRRVVDRLTPRAEAASRAKYARERVRVGGRFVSADKPKDKPAKKQGPARQ